MKMVTCKKCSNVYDSDSDCCRCATIAELAGDVKKTKKVKKKK